MTRTAAQRILAIVMAAYAVASGCYNIWLMTCGDTSAWLFLMLAANIILAGLMVPSIIRPDDPHYLRRILTGKRDGG